MSTDGKEVWAANSHDGTVSIIDVAKKSVVHTLNVGTRMSNRFEIHTRRQIRIYLRPRRS